MPAPLAAVRLIPTRLNRRDHQTRPRRTRKRPWRVFALSEERGQRMAETMAAGQDLKAIERLRDAQRNIQGEIGKAIVGQADVIEGLMTALFAGCSRLSKTGA